MGMEFTPRESSTLYGLLAESTTDVILKTDRAGFIRHASQGIEQLGFTLPDLLIGPHITDLVDPTFVATIRAAHEEVIRGRQCGDWLEFFTITNDGNERWFAMRMRMLADERDRSYGAVCVLRNIEETRTLERKLFEAELTDPLTGLTNRTAFVAMLQHLIEIRARGCLALLDIDHFRAINLRYGQSTGDQVLVAFARFLQKLTRSADILSRVGGESFAILLPSTTPDAAEALCQRIVSSLAELGEPAGPDRLAVTASAGVAPFGRTFDSTMKAAEMAVLFAKSTGRNGVELAGLNWPV